MPELPEVERGRRLAESIALRRTIHRAIIERDPIVYERVPPRTVQNALEGRTVLAVNRHGKQLWFDLDEPPHPLFHFGMSGEFRAPNDEPVRYISSGKKPLDRSWPPKWAKIRLIFDDGSELAMIDKRRFGRIRLRENPRAEHPIAELGFDPLLNLPPARTLMTMLRTRRAPIKAVLLDQSFAAGVGNWIADEVLYQAKIDPQCPAHELNALQVRAMRAALKHIISRAVAVNAEKHRFPKSWLFHHRWGKNASATTARGEPIEFLTVAGRTTAWVPTVQRPSAHPQEPTHHRALTRFHTHRTG